jgi:hypothetical protein
MSNNSKDGGYTPTPKIKETVAEETQSPAPETTEAPSTEESAPPAEAEKSVEEDPSTIPPTE